MAAAAKLSEGRLSALLPRRRSPRLSQLRRDLRTVIADLRGQRAPAWLPRDGARYPAARPSGLATRSCEIVELRRETADAITLVLAGPSGAPWPELRPGQFFTLLVDIDGQTLRRAYSISSDCRERQRVSVTIKRVAGGRVSNWLNDHAAVGMKLRVLGPSGDFGVDPDPDRVGPRKLVMIAGGSGITPMMALCQTLLPGEADCRVALIYGNRRAQDVIFADALAELAERHGSRFELRQALEQPPGEWSGATGRLDAELLARELDALELADDPEAEFLICGPEAMMTGARELLAARGVAEARVHCESFSAPHASAEAAAKTRSPQPLTLLVDGREIGVVAQPGQSVLEAGLAAGLAMPYSCAMGGCGACKLELERGEVVMREPNCLGAREREAGYVLACVSHPTGPCRLRVDEGSS